MSWPGYAYNLLLHLALILLWPFLLIAALLSPKLRPGLPQRLGLLPLRYRRQAWVGEGCIWLHAASLGEVNALLPVAALMARALPREPFVFTCTTQAGLARAQSGFPQARAHLLLPLDLPWMLRPLLRRYQPRLCVIAETELWPNFIRLLKQQRCRVMVANGRLTQKSLEGYNRFRPLFHEMALRVDCWAMQSQEDAQRIKLLGANPLKVVVAGNTKYDAAAAQPPGDPAALKAQLGFGARRRVLVAGSTRPGEEAGILAAFAELAAQGREWALLLAPRHLERSDEVLGLVQASGLSWRRRSAPVDGPPADVVVLDTLGELAGFYACAELALVGGSFADWGGQNPLEPAALGLPLVFGPSMRHFRDIAADLLAAGAACQVSLPELAGALAGLAGQPRQLKAMGKAGRELVAAKAGAARRNADMALKLYTIDHFQNRERHWREDAAYPAQKTQEFGAIFERHDA